MKQLPPLFVGLFRGLLLLFLIAGSQLSIANEEEDILLQVKENTNQLIKRLEEERGTFHANPDKFYTTMDESLSNIVDFRRIAARVMGKYRKQATDSQKDQFVETFKKSLFNAYGKTLVDSGDFNISVQKANINPNRSNKASVDLEISTSSGSSYPIIYNMYKNSNQNKWLLENVIVNGVNVGLAFRDRFQQEYEQQRGDLDKVIGQWSAELTGS